MPRLGLLSVTREAPSPGRAGAHGVCEDCICWAITEKEAATAAQPVCLHSLGWQGRFPRDPLPHTDYPACLRAPTRCGSGPQGHHAGWAELSERVLSSRREAICLLLWAGVAPRGLGVSLLRDLGLQGAGLICAGLICGGLSTQGLSAAGGLMRRRSALTDVSPSPCLEGFRRRLTVL